ncbi:hypothetical protein M569_13283 [Genlisea aurea]|uniref:Uncharacterized protein n=1 Tax=Genlisea aurea TaxID=192259 RepID=S8C4C7_9LAMI|nr:hypothetical protein M569_13283 [Genlisea aurea]
MGPNGIYKANLLLAVDEVIQNLIQEEKRLADTSSAKAKLRHSPRGLLPKAGQSQEHHFWVDTAGWAKLRPTRVGQGKTNPCGLIPSVGKVETRCLQSEMAGNGREIYFLRLQLKCVVIKVLGSACFVKGMRIPNRLKAA